MPKARVCVKMEVGAVGLTDLDLPDPGPGQALVRTTLTTICGSDLHIAKEIPEVPAGMPMGHEAVGVVEAVGPGVERFGPGDHVVSSCLMSCGGCTPCTDGEPNICQTFGAPMNLLFGAQSDMFLVNGADYTMTPIPASVDERAAVLASDVLSTGFGAIERAGLKRGQSVAIFAQGPVGLSATIAAKFHGAEPLIAVEAVPARVEMARRLGADVVVAPQEAVERIMQMTDQRGVDVAVEALGKQETFEACCRVTRLGGVVSSVGVYGGIDALRLPTDGSFFHRTLVTTFCPAGSKRLDYLLGLIDDGNIEPTPLFTHERPLAEIVAAYEQFAARADGVIKIAIR